MDQRVSVAGVMDPHDTRGRLDAQARAPTVRSEGSRAIEALVDTPEEGEGVAQGDFLVTGPGGRVAEPPIAGRAAVSLLFESVRSRVHRVLPVSRVFAHIGAL